MITCSCFNWIFLAAGFWRLLKLKGAVFVIAITGDRVGHLITSLLFAANHQPLRSACATSHISVELTKKPKIFLPSGIPTSTYTKPLIFHCNTSSLALMKCVCYILLSFNFFYGFLLKGAYYGQNMHTAFIETHSNSPHSQIKKTLYPPNNKTRN